MLWLNWVRTLIKVLSVVGAFEVTLFCVDGMVSTKS